MRGDIKGRGDSRASLQRSAFTVALLTVINLAHWPPSMTLRLFITSHISFQKEKFIKSYVPFAQFMMAPLLVVFGRVFLFVDLKSIVN